MLELLAMSRTTGIMPVSKSVFAIIVLSLLAQAAIPVEPVRISPDKAPGRPIRESAVRLPAADGSGTIIQEVQRGSYRLKLDMSEQVIRMIVPLDLSGRTPQTPIGEGDTVVVTDERAALQVGNSTIVQLAKGQVVTVSEVRGEWLATAILVGGQSKTGWLKLSSVRFHAEQPRLAPTLAGLTGGKLVSAALLAQKAKQFDDGLYATVELAAQQGAGRMPSKAGLVARMADVLARQQIGRDDPRLTVLAAARLGGFQTPVSADVNQAVSGVLDQFQQEPWRSRPVGFYTWSTTLQQVFQQDRMLQTNLEGEAGIKAIAEALRSDNASRASYEAHLKLMSKLTNPLQGGDLRLYIAKLDGDQTVTIPKRISFFPPSRSHEADLIMRLFGDRPIPADFDLMEELIARIRSGKTDLSPTAASGLYDYQTWALEPLLNPEKTPEAVHLKFDESYRKQLVELFKGILALTRETHIKQVPPPAPAPAGEPDFRRARPSFRVTPALAVEPLATIYLRRALAYRFIRGVLEEAFGVEALKKLHRLTAAGEVETSLSDELHTLESLFHGAYLTANRQLGLESNTPVPTGTDAKADIAWFLKWSANLDHDVDIGQDARMMVPVFFDVQRRKTKVWVVLGWMSRQVCISFATPPRVQVFDKAGAKLEVGEYDLHFEADCEPLAYPVMAEVYVDEILDRGQFRRHCDTYKTEKAILANLK